MSVKGDRPQAGQPVGLMGPDLPLLAAGIDAAATFRAGLSDSPISPPPTAR
jgi:hypothetical protein